MCVPAGLLAITTGIVLYANLTVTKRAQKFYVHNVDCLNFKAMQGITHSNVNLFFFSTSFTTELPMSRSQYIFTMLIT